MGPEDLPFVSYLSQNKNKKSVTLVSTMYLDNKINQDSDDTEKPDIITFYNSTKRVAMVDMMMDKYSVARNRWHWPLCSSKHFWRKFVRVVFSETTYKHLKFIKMYL